MRVVHALEHALDDPVSQVPVDAGIVARDWCKLLHAFEIPRVNSVEACILDEKACALTDPSKIVPPHEIREIDGHALPIQVRAPKMARGAPVVVAEHRVIRRLPIHARFERAHDRQQAIAFEVAILCEPLVMSLDARVHFAEIDAVTARFI